MIHFDSNLACWFYTCAWGCYAFDFEGEQEARDNYIGHLCPGKP